MKTLFKNKRNIMGYTLIEGIISFAIILMLFFIFMGPRGKSTPSYVTPTHTTNVLQCDISYDVITLEGRKFILYKSFRSEPRLVGPIDR